MPIDQVIPLGTETRPEIAARMAQARGLMLLVKQATGQMILCSRKLPGWQRWIVAIHTYSPEAA
jgi:hypothetical protein